jgi:hypothetical protein
MDKVLSVTGFGRNTAVAFAGRGFRRFKFGQQPSELIERQIGPGHVLDDGPEELGTASVPIRGQVADTPAMMPVIS